MTRWSAAVRDGEVDESVIDDHLARILLLAERVGALGADRETTRPTCRRRTVRNAGNSSPGSPRRASPC